MLSQAWGLGDANATFRVYIANQPNMLPYNDRQTKGWFAMSEGNIHNIGAECGNGWRKVFNVYAKLVFALKHPTISGIEGASRWQDYRDNSLLSANSNTALIFHSPDQDLFEGSVTHNLQYQARTEGINLIMGKGYAKRLAVANRLIWMDNDFAIAPEYRTLVCPYFDYRQLSNLKIIQLVAHIQDLLAVNQRPCQFESTE